MRNIFTRFNQLALLILLCFALPQLGKAQGGTISFTLLHQPCNNDGILVAYDSLHAPPITFSWVVGNITHVHVSNTNYDTIFNYSGAFAYVSDSGTNYGYYLGAPPFTFTDSTTAAVCPALGTAHATVNGTHPPYSFQWLNSSNVVVSTTNPAQLPAGNYQLIITDSAGCVSGIYNNGGSGGNYQGVYIQNVSSVAFTIATTVANCTNGTAAVTGLHGGIAPYSYHWNNGATSDTITGLIMGGYNLTVTDSIGCYTTNYTEVHQAVTITPHTTITNATCLQNNGQIIAFGSGGVPPYTYAWSNGQNTQTATSLTAGYYYVTVSDSNHCIGQTYAGITSSTPINVVYSSTPSLCTSPTGTATVLPTGGTAPYTIQWYTYPSQTGNTATGLAQGTYSFLVTDSAGCVRSGTVYVPPISILTAYMDEGDAMCTAFNGAATLIITSGTPPYQYHWSTGATSSAISGLQSGGYSCTVTDNLNCTLTKTTFVHAATPIQLGLNSNPASCIYVSDGSITVTPVGGTAPYSYYWSNGENTAIDTGLATGYYTIYVSDAAGCTQYAWTDLSYDANNNSCYCTLTGIVYNDANNNCIADADSGEAGIQNIMIHCSGLGYSFTDAYGNYSFLAPTGTYTLSENVESYYPLASCQSNAVVVNVIAGSGCVQTNNFANVINPIHDVSIVTASYNSAVPGYGYRQKVVVQNNGTITEPGIQMGYAHDGQLALTGETPSLFTQQDAGNYPNWYSIISGFPSLAPAAFQTFEVDYAVPTNIPLGTSVTFKDTTAYTSPITNWLNDYTPWNNTNAYETTVVGSFDPNEKEVSPKGGGAQGFITVNDSVLTFTIHFQNTGSYPAQKIIVIDSIDKHLDITTLRPGYSNYTYTTTADDSGTVKFTFDNINLPDSLASPQASTCLLMYTIHQKPNLPNGTQIKSPAYVYFDFNSPVKTNTTLNTIKNVTGIVENELTAFDFIIYPNPANNVVSLLINSEEAEKLYTMKIYNLVGDVMQSKTVRIINGKNIVATDVSSFASGLYFVEVSDGQHSLTGKLSLIR